MNNEFMFTPYFTKFDFSKTWRIIKKLDNSQIINLGFYFESRYRKNIYGKIFPEREFLENLNKKVEDSISNKNTKKLKKVALKFLSEKIIESIKNFPE